MGGERLLLGTAVEPGGKPSGGAGVSMATGDGTGVVGAGVPCIAGDEKAGGLVFGADVLTKGGELGVRPSAHQTHQLRSGCWAQVLTVSSARCMLQMGGRELGLDTAKFVPGIVVVVAGTPGGPVTSVDVKVAGLLAGGGVMGA